MASDVTIVIRVDTEPVADALSFLAGAVDGLAYQVDAALDDDEAGVTWDVDMGRYVRDDDDAGGSGRGGSE